MQRISYNKAQELANHIEGATLRTFDSGTVAIYLNAVVPNGDKDAPMVEATMYNKKQVTTAEAIRLIQERHPFVLKNEHLKGLWIEDEGEQIYVFESYGAVIAQIDSHGIFVSFADSQIETLKGREMWSQKATMRKHMETILEALDRVKVEEEYSTEDFGL